MVFELFRGDNYLNDKTNPGIYRGNGLTSKAFWGNDDPAYINKNGLLETIRQHITPHSKQDYAAYDVTGFLSFSEDKQKALEWASGKKSGLIEVSDDYHETRYVFTVSFNEDEMTEIHNSIFEFKYACNRHLKKANSPDPHGISSYALQHNVCELCHNKEKEHSLILIDTVKFLEKHKHLSRFEGAHTNASADKEWLLLPNDPLGKFKSARIQRADFWFATHYRLQSEPPRDSTYFSKNGYI